MMTDEKRARPATGGQYTRLPDGSLRKEDGPQQEAEHPQDADPGGTDNRNDEET